MCLFIMYAIWILNLPENTSDFTTKSNKISPSATPQSPGSKRLENITDTRCPLGKGRMLQRVYFHQLPEFPTVLKYLQLPVCSQHAYCVTSKRQVLGRRFKSEVCWMALTSSILSSLEEKLFYIKFVFTYLC
jgi:hypothetical protein